MTTQEKYAMLEEMRAKREMKKKAQQKAKRRKRIAAMVTLAAIAAATLGTVYNASAKEITITEINEFTGKNETQTVKTRSDKVEEVLEEHGVDVGEADKLNVPAQQSVSDNDDIVIKRGKRVTIKVGDHENVVTVTSADVTDALVEAGYIPGEYDQISANGDTLMDSDRIELVTVSLTDEVTTETIAKGVEYIDDPNLPKGQEKVVDEGQDGLKEITHKITYENGAETAREVLSENIVVEVKNKVIAKGTAEPVRAASTKVSDIMSGSKTTVSDDGGTVNGYKYKKKITMTATAYSTSPSENGGYTVSAMGNKLGFGIVAVDPKVVPLGSKVYVTSPDGSWTYGVASAEDTGGAIKGNRIDLCYGGSVSEVNSFGRRSCVVYVLE